MLIPKVLGWKGGWRGTLNTIMTHPQQTATVCIFKWCHLTLLSLHSSLTSLVLHPSEWSSWGHPVVLDCYLQLFQQPRCDPEDKWIWKQNCLDRPVQECGFHFFFSSLSFFFPGESLQWWRSAQRRPQGSNMLPSSCESEGRERTAAWTSWTRLPCWSQPRQTRMWWHCMRSTKPPLKSSSFWSGKIFFIFFYLPW